MLVRAVTYRYFIITFQMYVSDPPHVYTSPVFGIMSTTVALNALRRPVRSLFRRGRPLALLGEALFAETAEELPEGVHEYRLVKNAPAKPTTERDSEGSEEADTCFVCLDEFRPSSRFGTTLSKHKSAYIHTECADMLVVSAKSKRTTPNLMTCPVCRDILVTRCSECSKFESTTEIILDYHGHPGYNVCLRCVAYSANAQYEAAGNAVFEYHLATCACSWCEQGKMHPVSIFVADVVPEDVWPTIRVLKEFQLSVSKATHELAVSCKSGHGPAARLLGLYREFY